MSDVSGLMREPKIQLYLEFLVYATLTRLEIFSHNNLLGWYYNSYFMDEQTEAQ